ncbi:hypothetical protein LINPERPRIM_LOCUS21964 [Linum perenne]
MFTPIPKSQSTIPTHIQNRNQCKQIRAKPEDRTLVASLKLYAELMRATAGPIRCCFSSSAGEGAGAAETEAFLFADKTATIIFCPSLQCPSAPLMK